MAEKGHEERFPLTRLSAGRGFKKETIAGRHRNGRDAPFPALRRALAQGVKSTLESHSCPKPSVVAPARERTFVPDFGTCQSPAYANASSSAFASLRSGVSKPSVNQP